MEKQELEILVRTENGTVVLVLKGRLNTITSPDLQAKINQIVPDLQFLDLDFTEVEHIASAGLRVLAATDERLEGNGGKLRVLHPNAAVREVLDMTGFSDILTIV